MEYSTPKELSAKFDISLRKVYYALQNNKDTIRTSKQWKTRLVNIADFANACNFELAKSVNDLQKEWQKNVKSNPISEWEINFANLQKSYWILQKKKTALQEQTENLQNFNSSLTTQVQKYALLLTEEKTEKKDLLEKYDNLHRDHIEKIEQFSTEKVKLNRKVYLLIGFCSLLLLLLAILFSPYFLSSS